MPGRITPAKGPKRWLRTPSRVVDTPLVPTIDDGDDSWWSGQQLNFAQTAIAGAAAAIALSAAICGALQQQTDEVASWLPSEASGSPAANQRAYQQTLVVRWTQGDELPSQAFLGEAEWAQPPPAVTAPVSTRVFSEPDEIVPKIEEEYWLQLATWTPIYPSAYAVDDDFAAPQAVAADDDPWFFPTLPPPAVVTVFSWNDEVVPWLAGEAASGIPTQRAQTAPVVIKWTQDEDLPATPQAMIDEQDWQPPVPAYASPVGYAPPSDELIVPQPAGSIPVDEEPWPCPTPKPIAPIAPVFSSDDEVASWLAGDASSAGATQRAHIRPLVIRWGQSDDITQPPAPIVDDSDWSLFADKIDVINGIIWATDEEVVPQPPTSINFDEETWPCPVPAPVPAKWYALHHAEEITQVPPPLDDGDWQPYEPSVSTVNGIIWATDETLTSFLTIEEEDWRVYTPPPVGPKPLHLPDPEELTFIPPPPLNVEEEYWAANPTLNPVQLYKPVVVACDYDDIWLSGIAPVKPPVFGRHHRGLRFIPNQHPEAGAHPSFESLSSASATSLSTTEIETDRTAEMAARPSAPSDYRKESDTAVAAADTSQAELRARSWFDLRPSQAPSAAELITDPQYQAELLKPISDEEVIAALKFLR